MRISATKGASSRVILAILYTSLLWFMLDVLLLSMYASVSDEKSGSTLKLPTNSEHQRNIREDELEALSGDTDDDSVHKFINRNKSDRTLNRYQGKRSRFTWGNRMRDLAHSNLSKDDSNGEAADAGVINPAVLIREEKMREIDTLKKQLSNLGDHEDTGGAQKRLSMAQGKLAELNQIRDQPFQRFSQNKVDKIETVYQHNAALEKDMETKDRSLASLPGTHKVKDLDVTSMPRDPSGAGEYGVGVQTKPEDEAKVKIGWEHAYFNEFVSDMISVERSLPDVRKKGCRAKEYSNNLPTTSIIICFTEESWSTLLRTVHSVLNRSPPELIEEVILVDDFSQRDYLKDPLDEYMRRLPKVKIVRLPKREGLIRARIIGADMARGKVLTFLDSHVECNVGWLEPLLQRIYDNPANVICPSIDSIDAKTFQYTSSGQGIIGAFTWEMKFTWNPIPNYETSRRRDDTWPIRTPAMAGGLFSIDKAFFYTLGTYDPGFDIWGAENLELSFKVWMCGGALEIIPCSRVAHIFRKQQPYKFPEGNMKTFMRNTMRLVEVWVDEPYKDIFYSLRPQLMGQDFGDVSDRIQLRRDLKCRDFKWYLDNVFPALQIPDTKVRARGEVKNLGNKMCLDSMGKSMLGLYPCHGEGNNQAFSLSWKDTFHHKSQCLSSAKNAQQLALRACGLPTNVHFKHSQMGVLQDLATSKCLDVNSDNSMAVLRHCDGRLTQRWTFSYYFNRSGKVIH